MTEERYEVVIIGGGIHGVGVAQAAAAAGYETLVLEKSRIATGTSSRSSKLIHGGLRYLANGQLGLVNDCLRERELLLRLAPDLVHRLTFFAPVYPTSRYRPWKLRVGLSIYALLAGLTAPARYRSVPETEWPQLDGLRREGLSHVFEYTDAQTDDVALTRAVMRSAESLGAVLRCPAEFVCARRERESYRVEYRDAEGAHAVEAAVVVNATGPWIEQVHRRVDPRPTHFDMDLVQGAHVVVDHPMQRGAYYAESPRDGRPIFFMPWEGSTLVGTTETAFTGDDPGQVRATDAEIEYLLSGFQHYFPDANAELVTTFAGLRVLPRATGSFGKRARETSLLVDRRSQPRWLTIAGGKLTSYRSTASRVLAKLRRSLPRSTPRASTRHLTLTRCPVVEPTTSR